MDEVIVRWFQPQDAEAVVRLHDENKEWFEELTLTKDFVVECSQRSDFRMMVAEQNGIILGFIGALFFESVGRAEIGPISTSQNFKDQGVGSRLLSSMIEFLKTIGIHRIIAHVKANNLNAIKFFLNNGFTFEAYLAQYTKKREDVMQMLYLIRP